MVTDKFTEQTLQDILSQYKDHWLVIHRTYWDKAQSVLSNGLKAGSRTLTDTVSPVYDPHINKLEGTNVSGAFKYITSSEHLDTDSVVILVFPKLDPREYEHFGPSVFNLDHFLEKCDDGEDTPFCVKLNYILGIYNKETKKIQYNPKFNPDVKPKSKNIEDLPSKAPAHKTDFEFDIV